MEKLVHKLGKANLVMAIGASSAALVCVIPAAILLVLPLLGACLFRLRRRPRLTTLGSARWAAKDDLLTAGMLATPGSGPILGTADLRERRPHGRPQRSLPRAGEMVRLPNAVHTAVFAPTGVGKGVSMVIPQALVCPDSMLFLDFKGELANGTARHREKMFKHRIVLVDPYRVVTQTPDTLNPLDPIDRNAPTALDDCNDIANALVVRSGKETEPHWNDSAESVIAAVAATIVGYSEPGERSLNTLREIIGQPSMLELSIKLMLESPHWNGALRPMGGQLLHLADREKASVLSSAMRHLRFLGTPAIMDSTARSSFDPRRMRHEGMSVYLILPPDRASAQTGLLRMWVASILRACVRGGLAKP
jgi:type IV secretion system protein VirD4